MKSPAAWRHGPVEQLSDCRVFTVGASAATSPTTGREHTFYRIDSADWVNVIPVTPRGEIVMVRQCSLTHALQLQGESGWGRGFLWELAWRLR